MARRRSFGLAGVRSDGQAKADQATEPKGRSNRIARSIPGARLVTLNDCGHFSYLECPAAVRKDIDNFFHRTKTSAP
jgi:pimeloyl-ACP methyl ester carboxylesterase